MGKASSANSTKRTSIILYPWDNWKRNTDPHTTGFDPTNSSSYFKRKFYYNTNAVNSTQYTHRRHKIFPHNKTPSPLIYKPHHSGGARGYKNNVGLLTTDALKYHTSFTGHTQKIFGESFKGIYFPLEMQLLCNRGRKFNIESMNEST